MPKYLLHNFIIENHIKAALEEDIGFGDISTDYLVSDDDEITAYLNTREDGILCGIDIVKKVFKTLSRRVSIAAYFEDGDEIKVGETVAKIVGPARFILTGERTALNYVQRLSGIATETKKYQDAIQPYKAHITDTRKTTPGFRMFEKYAVKIGGAKLHRFNLSDCVMLKDNHIKIAGSIKEAVKRIRENTSHAHKIEVECDTVDQVKEALKAKVDIIMLDNMSINEIKESVLLIGNKAIIEASGNVNLSSVNEIASTGVHVISSSAIVAKARTLDIALDM